MDDVLCVDFDNVDLLVFFVLDELENKIYCMFSNVCYVFLCGGDMWKNELNINMKLICNLNCSFFVILKFKLKLIFFFLNVIFVDDSVY